MCYQIASHLVADVGEAVGMLTGLGEQKHTRRLYRSATHQCEFAKDYLEILSMAPGKTLALAATFAVDEHF